MSSPNTSNNKSLRQGAFDRDEEPTMFEQFISKERAVAMDPFIGTRTKQMLEERFTPENRRFALPILKHVQVIAGILILLIGLASGIYLGYRSTTNREAMADEASTTALSHELFISQIQLEEQVPFVKP